jgi:hypothetical protein
MTRSMRALSALACTALIATPAAAPVSAQPTAPKRQHRSFCQRHRCIPNFYNGHGSIVQCRDGMWSHSGGRPGACSHHGGVRGKIYVRAARSCGHVRASGLKFHVTVERGQVSCHQARHVLKAFLSGKGHMHGPRTGRPLTSIGPSEGGSAGTEPVVAVASAAGGRTGQPAITSWPSHDESRAASVRVHDCGDIAHTGAGSYNVTSRVVSCRSARSFARPLRPAVTRAGATSAALSVERSSTATN